MERESQMEEWLLQSGKFAISIIPWRQKLLADQFAGLAPLASSTFAGIDHTTAVTGCPIITSAIGWADCVLDTDLITGDHRIFIGNVVAAGEGALPDAEPLIYYANRYLRTD
jgi:flavin reductase (DIM6/NTAB) family NADH-FMN oxidoreductase RutF